MKNFLKKSLAYILTGSFTVILAACYGSPISMDYTKTIKATDENNNPISGLKVTLKKNNTDIDSSLTNSYGTVDFTNVNYDTIGYQIKIQDVDGEENLGSFKDTLFDLNSNTYYEIKLKK